jgi:purine-binding chemotaxis protein CheW
LKEIGSSRFLAFELDGNQYAIEVERVEVVLETVPITRVPQAPAHLKGVINYRGAVVPVADLRTRFAVEDALSGFGAERASAAPQAADASAPLEPMADGSAHSSGSSIIVLSVHYGNDEIVMGVLADAVREVVDIESAHIEKAPRLGGRGDRGLIAGIGEKDGRFIVILDIDAAFATETDIGFAGGAPNGSGGGRKEATIGSGDQP